MDAKSDTVAAIGMIAGVPTLVINDIPCKLSSEPQLVEKFRIEDGVVFIQYINANGDKVAEKVSLVEDAHEVKKHREESKQTDDAFSMLRELMHKHKNITAISLLEALLKNGDLQNELAKEKEITKKVYELQNSNHVLESDKKMLAADNQTLVNGLEDARKEITELKETIKSLALLVEEHKPGGKKIFGGSGDKMTEALYKKFLGLLGDKKVELAQKEEEISGKGGISEKVKRSDGFEIKF